MLKIQSTTMGDEARKLFGTDGIRGIANQEPMTAEMALRLGQAVAQRFLNKGAASSLHRASAAVERSLKQVAAHAAREAERQIISETLRATRGNKSQAAKALQTDYKTLHLKLKSLGIRARDFSP